MPPVVAVLAVALCCSNCKLLSCSQGHPLCIGELHKNLQGLNVIGSISDCQLSQYIYIYEAGGGGSPRGRQSGSLNWRKKVFHCGKIVFFHVVLFIVDVFQLRIIFFSSVEVEVNYGPSQYVFFGVLIFSIGITRCTFCAISKIIGKGYNILCFRGYFDAMLFFTGNSQWFCISSKFPSAVSQLFFCVFIQKH